MRLEVRGRTIDLPLRCACCGRPHATVLPALPGVNIPRVLAAAWSFPVCERCARHAAYWQSATGLVRWLRIGGLAAAFIAGAAGCFGVLLALAAAALVLAPVAGVLRRREARTRCYPECPSAGAPVFYLGSRGEIESFEFLQQGYAVDVMRANMKRLVHLSSEARRLIQPDLDREAAQEAERKAMERERVRIAAEVAHDNEVYEKCVARIDAAKGLAGRRQALEAGLRALRQEHMRGQLMLQASRIDVAAALAKAEALKSGAAKLRTLSEALAAVRSDAVPDHLQLELIRSLEAAIAKIEDEKNSIDMV